ncbi:NAD(P)-dependent oxidoreductase [Alteribacillus sp. HJP-4]|uniref:NAD(P)-dependent oxidoreductase n=1 Tax=Alteribacillus sp. HJP-4 TaxID=2775394 RepID=UPI0035CCD6D6
MKKLGFIGLGNMGMPMAVNLVKAGYEVYGLNRSKGKEKTFEDAGGKAGMDLPDFVAAVDVVMTCLPVPADVENMILGENGVLSYAREGQLIIDFSTVTPSLHSRIEEAASAKQVKYLDAPVSGGTTGAEAGSLAVMVGGSEAAFSEAEPYFDVVGANVTHAGPIGNGTKVKLINQYMVGMHTAAVSEGLYLAEAAGIDQELLYKVLSGGFAQSKIFDRHYTQFISQEKDEPGFALKLLLKDLGLVEELAGQANVQLSAGAEVRSLFEKADESGLGDKDMSVLYQFVKHHESK